MVQKENAAIAALMAEIRIRDEEIAAAERVADKLVDLRKTRALLAKSLAALKGEPVPGPAGDSYARGGRPLPGSIGDRILKVIRSNGGSAHIRAIGAHLNMEEPVPESSVSATLATYARRGWVRRIETGVYELPAEESEAPKKLRTAAGR